MSKSIYEKALDIINEALEQPDNSVIFKHTGLNELKKALKQAQKQEKLLELYKQIALIWERRYEYTNSVGEREKLWKIVKELENENNYKG